MKENNMQKICFITTFYFNYLFIYKFNLLQKIELRMSFYGNLCEYIDSKWVIFSNRDVEVSNLERSR